MISMVVMMKLLIISRIIISAFKYTLPERNYLHILQFRISRICL